jgi:hypothetical protein
VTGGRLRLLTWATVTVVSLGYYAVKTIRLPSRTEVGVERRLFGRVNTDIQALENPAGGRWVFVPEGTSTGQLSSSPAPARLLIWADSEAGARKITFIQPDGSWRLDGLGSLRRAWRFKAVSWSDDTRLKGQPTLAGARLEPVELDLRTGRTSLPVEGSFEDFVYPSDAVAPLTRSFEDRPADLVADEVSEYPVAGRKVSLVYGDWHKGAAQTVYAVSDDPAPRVLRIARNAWPVELSKDGRTLFFNRNNALWRLDLRKPITELLDEVPVPELPDPLTSSPPE